MRALESRRQSHVLILLRSPRAQRARALEVSLEKEVTCLRLRETREANHEETAGKTDSLPIPQDTFREGSHMLASGEFMPLFQSKAIRMAAKGQADSF